MLNVINCHANAQRKFAIMFLTILNAFNDAKSCILIFGATFL